MSTLMPGFVIKGTLTDNSATAQNEVGAVVYTMDATAGMRGYRYVGVAADTTVANGTALTFTDLYCKVASSDISDGNVTQVCGVGIGAITG